MGISLETIVHYFPEEVQELVPQPSVTDIMIVGELIFVKERGEKRLLKSKIDAFSLRTAINYLAGECQESVNENAPVLDGRLPDCR